MILLAHALKKLASHQSLTEEESFSVFSEILEKEFSELHVAALLIGLRTKGETAEEILGCVRVLRERAETIKTKHSLIVDTCGTGGDGAKTFNISTAAAIVASGAGVVVAKHGNRAVSSQCGSADMLEALGIPVDISPKTSQKALDEIGLAFLFAPKFHPTLKKLASLRKELGCKTIFNIAGPLANPVHAERTAQVVGVFEKGLVPIVAEVLKKLGTEKGMVVYSNDGLDEISNCDDTIMAALTNNHIQLKTFSPEQVGIKRAALKDLKGGDAKENAKIISDILNGFKSPARDAVVLNAAAACLVSGMADSFEEALKFAQTSIDSGKAKEKLNALKQFLSNNKSEASHAAK